MKQIIIALVSALVLGCASAKADIVIGYDGPCTVYFNPQYGYQEVCEDETPIVLGWDFDVHRFRHGFHEGPGFHEHFGQHWQGPHMKYQYRETATVKHKGR